MHEKSQAFGPGFAKGSEALHVLDFLYLLEVAADVVDVSDIVYAEFDFGCEKAVAGLDVYAVDVDVELL